jgi:hypothetical protein
MRVPLHLCVAILLIASTVPSARAAATIEALKVDLSPLIDESAHYPIRFAVDVPHPVSATSEGRWIDNGSFSTWKFTTRIETAVSSCSPIGQVKKNFATPLRRADDARSPSAVSDGRPGWIHKITPSLRSTRHFPSRRERELCSAAVRQAMVRERVTTQNGPRNSTSARGSVKPPTNSPNLMILIATVSRRRAVKTPRAEPIV